MLKHWIDTWIFDLNHEYQYLHSFKRFEIHLKENKDVFGTAVHKRIKDIIVRMDGCSLKWAKCYKHGKLDLEHPTSSIGESSNSSMKKFDKTKRMSSRTIQSSASTQRNHSNHLHTQRTELIATDLNKVTCDIFMQDQNLLTTSCQHEAKGMFALIGNYDWIRDTATSWLVSHKNTFQIKSADSLLYLHLPKYSNTYRVVMNESHTKIWCKGCKKKARKGIPCVHVMVALQCCHAKMFHPRYLKAYNSWMYDENSGIRKSIDNLICQQKMDVSASDISMISLPDFLSIQNSPGLAQETISNMEGAERMFNAGKFIIRGQPIPSNFAIGSTGNDYSYQICDDESDSDSDNTAQYGDEHDFDATRSKKKKLKNGDNTEMYSFLQSFTKDVGKAVEGNGKRQGELKRELDQLLLSYQQKERIDKNIKSPAKSSTIVSISSQTETCFT